METICGIFVDDGNIYLIKESTINNIIEHLSQDYIKIEVIQGWIDYQFVGFQITTNFLNHPIFINQNQYIIDIINFFGMENVNPIVNPYNSHTLINVQVGPTNKVVHELPCKEVIGNLMYVMMMTWLDIAYVVSIAAWHNDQPKQSKWSIVKWILCYLQNTIDYGLSYYCWNYIKHNFRLFLWCWLCWKPRWLQVLNMVCVHFC